MAGNIKPPVTSLQIQQQHRNVARNCDALEEFLNRRRQVPEAIFNKFRMFFNRNLAKEEIVGDKANELKLRELSEEFRTYINPYEEFDVVDSTGKVLFPVPAIWTRISTLDEDKVGTVAAFDNALAKNHDKPWVVEKAGMALLEAMGASQKHDTLKKSAVTFMQSAMALHKSGVLATEFLGPGKFKVRHGQPALTGESDAPASKVEEETRDITADFDFGTSDEDFI